MVESSITVLGFGNFNSTTKPLTTAKALLEKPNYHTNGRLL